MADGQELDNLLIKVDSELGDLKGLTSAIDALQRLANFTKDASSGIKQIGQLGKAFHEFDNLKLDGLDEASRGVRNLVGALDDLSKVGNVTKKTFNQFGQLGKTLRDNFDGLGQSLQGIQEVAVGVNNLVSALRGLSQVTGVTKSAINSLGGVGDALHHFNGVDKQITNLVQPIKELMQAIGQLGNNNRVSIRIDNSGIAHVNQVLKNTRKQIKDANDWWKQTSNDRKSIDLSKMFDISQPTADLERNLSRAQRMIVTYENQTRTSLEKLHNMQSNFSMADLVNNQQFRNAFRSHMISDKMVEQIKEGIDKVSTELETRGAQRIEDAWRHTQEAIVNDSQLDLSRLIDTNLPVEEVRANLRTLQNELSRAESAMNRAYTNLHRLRSRESDENLLRGSQGYRDSAYTYATNAQFVRQYRDAIDSLNSSLREMEHLSQSDVALLRELPQLQQQLTRYQGTLDTLLANDDTSLEGQRTIDAFVRGVDYLEDRIREIQEQLGHVPETTEGVLETMRQVADEAERTARATAETAQNMRNSIGQGFSSFGGMLSGTGNPILGSLGNLSSMFGKAVQNGTARLSEGALASLQGVASTLGTIVTGISQVVAVAGVFIAVFKTWWNTMNKINDMFTKFQQSLKQFAKDMLTKVVGAFNAVAGAVSKVASAVRSGAEIVTSALRKISEFGEKVISVFARFGSFLGTVGKGAKAIANLITPRAVKNLASFNGSLKSIVKNTHLLNKALQVANKWFTMITRMLMRKIVQAFISSLKQAFEDMVLYEKNANDEMLRLNHNVSIIFSAMRRTGNQLMAIFEPLINAMAVPIESFLTTLTAMGENLAKFMAILTGQPYYLRAKKFYNDYGEEVEDTTKKVKNLTNGLDELNILNDKSSSTESDKPWDYYFEKVPVDGSMLGLPSLREILEAIKDWLRNIDWEKIKTMVRDFIHRLMVLINEILKDLELWGLFGDTLAQIFNTLMEAWNQFITDFDPVATEKALSELIVRALNGIDWDLIHENVELTAKKFAQFWNEVFKDKALWDSITTTIANFLNEVTHYFDTWAWTFDFKQMADTLTGAITDILTGYDYEQLRHAVEGWVTGIVDFINQAVSNKQFWKTLGDSFANIINSTLVQALQDLTKLNFVELSDSIKLAIKHAIDGIKWDDLKASVEQLAENLTKGINDFFGDEEFLTKVTTAFANFGNIILSAIRKSLETLGAKDIGNAIGTAIINGLKKVDWETVFLLPAEALNALSNAIRGLFDSIPEDFNLGTWLAEHFSLTLESIDWETIERNVESFVQMVTDTINGLLSNDRFWNNVNITLDKVLKITIKLLDPIVNIDGEKLGQRIAELVNTFVQSNTIKTLIADAGKVFMNLVIAVDVALNGIEWEQMGQQIADGIIEAVNNIWKNKNKIAKMIKDAFKSFSTLVETILKKMIDANAFKKLGEILGTIGLAVIEGMATFFEQNTDRIIQAMRQFGDSLANFITTHEDEIVNGLNKIIDGIVAIIDEFFNDKSKFNQAVNRVIKRLNLGKLVGMFIEKILTAFASKLNRLDAIWDAIIAHLDDFVAEIKKGLKRVAKALWNKLAGVLSDVFWGTLEEFAKSTGNEPLFLILQLRKLLTGSEDGSIDLLDIVKGIFFKNEGEAKESFLEKVKNKVSGFWDNLPWNKGKAQEVPVTVEPVVEDATLEDFELEGATVSKISASRLVVKTYEGETLTVDEMFADVLTLTDIIADKLTVKEIETLGKDEINNPMDKLYAGAPMGEGGVLGARREGFDTITARLLEITEKITAPLLEVAEKVTAPLLEIAEKIIAKLLEIKEKVTTPFLEAMQIVTPLLNVTDLRVENITAITINANLLNVADILANTLRVGTIEGQLSGGTSGGTSGGGYPISTGSFTLPSYEGWENIYSDIQMPNFAVGERWSDISGLAPSAEDFLNGLDNTYSDIVNGVTTAYNQLPEYLGGSGSTASGGTLSKNGATGLSAFDKKMADTLAGAKINNLPSSAEYIRDYLMGFIGNEAGVYGLMGNLYAESGLLSNNLQDTKIGEGVTQKDIDYTNKANANGKSFINDSKGYGLAQWTTSDRKKAFYESLNGRSVDDLDAQLEYLKSELMSSQYKNVLDKLRNASSIEEASDATLYGFEKPNDRSEATAGLRLAYGQDIAGQLGSYDGEVNIEDEETPTSDGMKNFDEVNVIGGKGGGSNPLSFLSSLPLQTEYLMAQVYDIIDKWLGRIWKLLKSFQIPDDLKKWLDALQNGDLSEIKIPVLDELKALIEQLNRLIAELTDVLKEVKDTIDDLIEAINNLKDKLDKSSATAYASAEAWSDSADDIRDAINDLGDRLSNIKCDCDCNCCNGCNGKGGGKPTPSNNVTDIPSGGTSSIKDIGDTPTPTSSTPSGGVSKGGGNPTSPINYTPSTTGGKVGGGQGNIDLNMPYGSVPMYALIDGKLVRLNDNLPDSVKKLIASGKVPITDAKGNEISSGDRSTMLGYLKDKGWLGDVDEDWLKNLRQSATNIKSDLLTPWENDITNQDKKDNYYQAKDLTDKLRQDGLSESEYKDTYDKLKQLATDSGLSSDKYADSDIPTTYSKDLEEYLGMPTVNESGDGGWLTNPANDNTDDKEYGVNTLDTQYRTDPESKTNIQDTIDKIKENQEKEDKGSKGAGTSKYDKETGITTYYDADGNEKGTYNTKTGEYSGDTIYARLSKAEKEKADKWKSTHTPNVKTGEIVDKDGNVTGHLDGNWGGKYWKDGKEYASEADYLKQQAEGDYGKAKKYWNMISQAYMVLNKQDKGDLEKVYQDAYKVYTQMTRPVSTDKQNELAKQLISIAENAGIDLSKSAYENAMKFKKDSGSSSSVASSTKASSVASGTVSKDSGTVTKLGQSFIDKFKKFIDKGNPFNTAYGQSSKDHPFDTTKAKQLFDGARNLTWVGFTNDKGTVDASSNPNYKLPTSSVKEAFDYWYKNRFLVKGYRMGGTPNSGELYMARENGSNEFIGSFGNKSVVANNEQIVTAVANGVSMANDRVVSAIQSQTGSLENAIDRKNLDVQIGDRQIAEANRRGEKGLGGNMVQ